MKRFVHLHLHTEYSILDGATKIPELLKLASECHAGAVAVTDHGVMYGICDLFKQIRNFNQKLEKEIERKSRQDATTQDLEEAKQLAEALPLKKLKFIAGVEGYLTFSKPGKGVPRYHIILLALNMQGYRNLCSLVSLSNLDENFYTKPCITYELLQQYSEGLVLSSACMAGPIARPILDMQLVQPSVPGAKEKVRVEGGMVLARKNLELLQKIFPGRFYLEIMLHPYKGEPLTNNAYRYQKYITAAMLLFAKEYSLPLLVTNDVHFLRAEDAELQQLMVAIGTSKKLSDPTLLHYSRQEYYKTYDELYELFCSAYRDVADCYIKLQESEKRTVEYLAEDEYRQMVVEGLDNSVVISDRVVEYDIESPPLMPDFPIPDQTFIESVPAKDTELRRWGRRIREAYRYLCHLVEEGAKQRWGDPIPPEYRERLNFELRTIIKMKFPGYFLIVADFIEYARSRGYPVGPGRGSAAGSAVSYCLRITDLDPVEYNLLFERFLNPDRISLPDIDVDLDDRYRAEIVTYLREKYGSDHVAGIATIGRSKIKNAINDVARVMDTNPEIVKKMRDALALDEEEAKRKKLKLSTLEEYYQKCTNLKKIKDGEPGLLKDFYTLVEKVEGSVRNIGQHACGYVISKVPLFSYAPIARVARATEGMVIQYESKVLESIGLVKMDLLGLRTLQIIDRTVQQVEQERAEQVDINHLDLRDSKTLELFGRAETKEVFQFESDGMRNYLQALKPSNLEDLIAMNALYRPGPLEQIPKYIKRKLGQEKSSYLYEEMEAILAPTFGVTVYQEQVMRLSTLLAGFSPGEADILRKAMGKKDEAKMEEEGQKMIERAVKNLYRDREIMEQIWEEWKSFGKYAFNRSHSACYAYVAYISGYLKAHYPCEYMASCLQSETDGKKMQTIGKECMRMGVAILPPSINSSSLDFKVTKGQIRFGLGRIKGISVRSMQQIIEEREANGPYEDLYNFLERIAVLEKSNEDVIRQNKVAGIKKRSKESESATILNSGTFESLVFSGALDELAPHGERYNLTCVLSTDSEGNECRLIEELMTYKSEYLKMLSEGGLFRGKRDELYKIKIPNRSPTEVQHLELLNKERSYLEMYLSAHPLDEYKFEIMYSADYSIAAFGVNKKNLCGESVFLAGMLSIPERKKKDVKVVESKVETQQRGEVSRQDSTKYRNRLEINLEDYTESIRLFVDDKVAKECNEAIKSNAKVLVKVQVDRLKSKEDGGDDKYWVKVEKIEALSSVRATGIKNFTLKVNSDEQPDTLSDLKRILTMSYGTVPLKIVLRDVITDRSLLFNSPTMKVAVNSDLVDQLLAIEYNTFEINDRAYQQNLFTVVNRDESEVDVEDLEDIAPID